MTKEGSIRRMLGPVITSMGGSVESQGGSGGESTLEITNNVDGYILKATGQANKVEGIPNLQYDSNSQTLSASANMFLTGSAHYLYLQGYGPGGTPVKFKVSISGSLLRIEDQ